MSRIYHWLAFHCYGVIINIAVVLHHGLRNRRENVRWYRNAGELRRTWKAWRKPHAEYQAMLARCGTNERP